MFGLVNFWVKLGFTAKQLCISFKTVTSLRMELFLIQSRSKKATVSGLILDAL